MISYQLYISLAYHREQILTKKRQLIKQLVIVFIILHYLPAYSILAKLKSNFIH